MIFEFETKSLQGGPLLVLSGVITPISMIFNDFAHIPWEDTPDFPNPPQGNKFLQNCWWRVQGIFQGYVGEILDYK